MLTFLQSWKPPNFFFPSYNILKKMEESVAKTKDQIDRIDKENAELKNKINELEQLLKQRYVFYTFEIYRFYDK